MNLPLPSEIKTVYSQGKNIVQFLKEHTGVAETTPEMIEIAYDLQAGSYAAAMADSNFYLLKSRYATELADTIGRLCKPATVLEAGVGEATTLSGVAKVLRDALFHGCDISWSRLAYARKWLAHEGISRTGLATGELLHMPYVTDAFDVVYTSHSIEPNRGSEEPIIRELLRIARQYVVLLEPGYELAGPVAQARMDAHGYCRNILETCRRLGLDVVHHGLFPVCVNELNPTAITIIKKTPAGASIDAIYACPRSGAPLVSTDGYFYSEQSLYCYPLISQIPCLRPTNAILCSHLKEVA